MLGQDGAVVFLCHGSGPIHAFCVQPIKSTLPIIPYTERHGKYIQDLYQNRTLVVKWTIITPSSKSNQHHNTINPSSLHSPSLPLNSLPPLLSPSSK